MGRPNEQAKARKLLTLYGFLRQQGLFSGRDDGDGAARIGVDDVAGRLGWQAEEVVRLAEALATCGSDGFLLVPLWIDEDAYGRILLCATRYDALAAPLRLTEDERFALHRILALTGIEEDGHLARKLSCSLIEQVPPDYNPLRMPTTLGDSHLSHVFHVIACAVADGHIIEFDYLKTGASEPEHRRVEPLSLSYERGRLYLVSYCTMNEGVRMFALERMSSPAETEEPSIPRAVDVRRFIDRLDSEFPLAQLRFASGFKIEHRDWPGARFSTPAPDGSVIVSIPFTGSAWLPLQIACQQGLVEALEPETLQMAVAETLERLRRAGQASLKAWQTV